MRKQKLAIVRVGRRVRIKDSEIMECTAVLGWKARLIHWLAFGLG